MTFANSVVGGTTLVRPAIQSPNFVAGSTGWIIRADGSAEFNNVTVRGDLIVGPTGTQTWVVSGANIPAALTTFYASLTIGAAFLQFSSQSPDRYTYQLSITTSIVGSTFWVTGQVNNGTVTEFMRWSLNASGVPNIRYFSSAPAGAAIVFDTLNVPIGTGYVVGFNDTDLQADGGVSMPRGVRGIDILTASSANVTAETVVSSFTQPFLSGRAYSVKFSGRVDTSDANGRPRIRLRKTNAAGTMWGDYGGWTTNVNVGEDQAVSGEVILRRTAGTDLNGATTCLTLEHLAGGANTARLVASATNPFFFGMWDIGAASSYPNAVAVT